MGERILAIMKAGETNNILYSHAQRKQTSNYKTFLCHIKTASEKVSERIALLFSCKTG